MQFCVQPIVLEIFLAKIERVLYCESHMTIGSGAGGAAQPPNQEVGGTMHFGTPIL